MIVTAVLHMFMALVLSITSAHSSFFTLYPMFLAFLLVGVALTVKQQKAAKEAS